MTEAIDTADLRRRVYDAARTPAIRLTPTTLKLAQAWRELVPDDVRRDLTASAGQTGTSATQSDEIR